MSKTCTIEGCVDRVEARGWCKHHYNVWRRKGDPMAPCVRREARLNGLPKPHRLIQETLVRASTEHCILWPFYRDRDGYPRYEVDSKSVSVTRYICLAHAGQPPYGKPQALHICNNGHLGCFNPHHLYWGSVHDNIADMANAGRMQRDASGKFRAAA